MKKTARLTSTTTKVIGKRLTNLLLKKLCENLTSVLPGQIFEL
jgi:hypothetical protein